MTEKAPLKLPLKNGAPAGSEGDADPPCDAARSRNMAAIHSRGTSPELFIRRLLFKRGFRYRVTPCKPCGHPDLYLARYRAVIFIHGCFWHRHAGCKLASVPSTRREFWNAKFARNVARDALVKETLLKEGYRYLVIWECTIRRMRKDGDFCAEMVDKIAAFIQGDTPELEL